jgi:hypothetical protein
VSFDDLFAQPGDEPGDEQEEDRESPPWWGPSSSELGICVPQNIVLARSDRAFVALSHALVYSTGVELDFVAFGRGLKQSEINQIFHGMHGWMAADEVPEEFLRLGLELADGSRASNLGRRQWHRDPESEPEGPLFHPHGGGGGSSGGRTFSTQPGYWLWPLPPPGPLRIWCEWPALDIPLSSAEVDASALTAAAARVERIWTD